MLRKYLYILIALIFVSSAQAQYKTKNVAIFVYEGVDILDIGAPGEILSNVMVNDDNQFISKAFNVFLVSLDNKKCIGKDFITLQPNYTIYDCPRPDVVIIPGGKIEPLLNSFKFMKWIKYAGTSCEVIMSIGSGTYALASAGLLEGKKATVWEDQFEVFKKGFPEIELIRQVKFTDCNGIITTVGSANSIDASLHIVLKLIGIEAANSAAKYINYQPWFETNVKLEAK